MDCNIHGTLFSKKTSGERKIVNNCSSSFKVKIAGNSSEPERNLLGQDTANPAIEAISLDMKQQELDGRCIQIRNLHKVYDTKKKREIAVLLTHYN